MSFIDKSEAESLSVSLCMSSSKSSLLCVTGKLVHPWHRHPGPQKLFFFLHPQILFLQPFLQLQPFNKKSIVDCILACVSGASHSISKVPSGLHTQPLSSGKGSVEYTSEHTEFFRNCATQQLLNQCRHREV